MLNTIKHGINLLRHSLRDIGISAKRSSKWPTVEKHFREANPTCAACGGKDRLNIHHVLPFHLFPEKELDPENLITMCMGKKECHLRLAHGSDFRAYFPDIRKYAEQVNKGKKTFEEVEEIAKRSKLYR